MTRRNRLRASPCIALISSRVYRSVVYRIVICVTYNNASDRCTRRRVDNYLEKLSDFYDEEFGNA